MLAGKLRAASVSALPLPEYVAGRTGSGGTGAVSFSSAPTGTQDGDLLVCLFYCFSGNALASVPTGFVVISSQSSAYGAISIAVKTASSESGSYAFSTGISNNVFGLLATYRNATRINTIGSMAESSTATITASQITPTYKGTLCALFVAETNETISIAPSGMTQRLYFNGTTSEGVLYDLSDQAAVATGTKSLRWGTTSASSALLFQITNEPTVAPEFVASASAQSTSSSTTQVVNKPAGTVEGDLMIAIMARDGVANWTGDTDWTEVADQNTSPSLRVAYKVAGASEPSSYTFTMGSISDRKAACILTYRYAAYDTIGSFTTANSPLILPSINPSESQSILIAAGARAAASTLGTPTSMTARVTDNNSREPSYIVCDQIVAKGPTGTRSMSTGSTNNVAGIMLSIKPTRSL